MGNKIPVLVSSAEPLLIDGIVNAIMATDDLEVIAKTKERVETITLVRKLQPRVAIIDFDPFERDIFQIIRESKKAYENVAILGLVSKTTSSCLRQSLQAGIAGYLLKTASGGEIITAIRGVCSGEAVLNLQSVYELMQHLDYAMNEQGHLGKAQHLSRRELEVLKLASKGLSNKKIAQELFISERTVQSQFGAIFGKLGVASRTEAVLTAWKKEWIVDEDFAE